MIWASVRKMSLDRATTAQEAPILLFTRSLALVQAFRRHWRIVSLASGSLLVAFGALLATGELVRLTAGLARFTGFSI
jgi:hypothetical protein